MAKKAFNEWIKDYNPNNVTLGPIIMAYLKRVYEHLEDDDDIILPLPRGVVSKYDVYQRTMGELHRISKAKFPNGHTIQVSIMTEPLYSEWLSTDDRSGVTEAEDYDKIRFIRHLKPEELARIPDGAPRFKEVRQKAGGFLLKVIDEICPDLDEQIKTWCCEMFAQKWKATNTYSQYELHVDNKFWKIYNPLWHEGDFGSCMAKSEWSGNWQFYINSVNASAAYITKRGSRLMVARCVIFNDVRCEETGEHFRYAERQYSTGKRDMLKTALVELLKAHGYIDIHKVIGASYDDRQKIVDAFTGESLCSKTFSIECSLINGDNISYQDSFGWYSPREHRAYNHTHNGANIILAGCGAWFYNEAMSSSRPIARHTWRTDAFHRRYVDSDLAAVDMHYINPVSGREDVISVKDMGDIRPCEDRNLWYEEDAVEYNDKWYPKTYFVQSIVDGCMLPKTEAIQLSSGDWCKRTNTFEWQGQIYHKSDLVYSQLCKEWSVKPMAVDVGGMWFPKPKRFMNSVLEFVRIDGERLMVRCSNEKWRDINDAEWDGVDKGWYDKKDYVNAWYPVRTKSEDGQRKYELRQQRIRKEYAWKCGIDGKWYHRFHIIKNVMTNEPMVKVPDIKFKGLINDAFRTQFDWRNSHCPVRTGLNEETYKNYKGVQKALHTH